MLNVRKHVRLAVPVGTALVVAAAVGGPALASTGSAAAKKKTTHGQRGPRGPRGLQGPQGPAGPAGTNGAQGAQGTSGTAAGGGAEATILYAANPAVATPNVPTAPTVIYAGHGLSFSATCNAATATLPAAATLLLQTGAGDAITVNGVATSPTPPLGAAGLNTISGLTATGVNNVLFAGTDGAVVSLQFQESVTQPGATCFVYGTRIGG